MPIGEINLVTPPEPLSETTDAVLAKESSEQNIVEIKQEMPVTPAEGQEEQDQFGLVDIPPLPDTPHPLPDAMVNTLVELPGVSDNDPPLDATITVPTIDDEGEPTDSTSPPRDSSREAETSKSSLVVLPVQNIVTAVPCLIILQDVSVKLKGKTSVLFPPQKRKCARLECVYNELTSQVTTNLDLEVKYVFMDATSGEDTKPDKKPKTSDKSAPSGYRLAAHRYMVAKKKGLIEEPRTRTQALKFPKTVQTTSTDSEATLDYVSDSAPPPRKRRRRQKTVTQGKLITKSFVL